MLDIFDDDMRVQVRFTVVPGSAFTEGTAEFLADIEGPVIPWHEAEQRPFALAIAASENGDLHRLNAPLIVLPHGAGRNKFAKPIGGRPPEVSGFTRRQLVRAGRVVPDALVVSHANQLRQLAEQVPEAHDRAVVAGDPCYDRIVASIPNRLEYRESIGISDKQRLVVVSSTWGGYSLLEHLPELPARLLAELPSDEFQVAAILHPAMWHRHGPWQVRKWLRTARESGLQLIPPREGWRACAIAADWLIGDHGSVTLYGAATGVPLLLAGFGDHEVVPGTPMADLGATAPRLDPTTELRPQLEAVADAHRPGRYDPVVRDAFALPGESALALRALAYRLMTLAPPPGAPAVRIVPPAQPEATRVTAHLVHTDVRDREIHLRRYPAAQADAGATDSWRRHLAVHADETDARLAETATVHLGRWAADRLRSYPGARLAAAPVAPRSWQIHVRDTGSLRLDVHGDVDPAIGPSAVHAWLTAHRDLGSLDGVEVVLGTRRATLRVTYRSSSARISSAFGSPSTT
ncbi:hypothetical protein EV193_10584 [Herbihabitans rhizosphaerae]|uniref:CDP-glycerol:poly(Glycerophosphate) glycerophosphotransferase n=1 Tax=Herbihabitans rhizosphaerae TaxID=1872711 RepID=A0A4Q7KLL3_9PSEU|nr:hypothetical protein [Herbihabitans rhizosphaerae]RZS37529.1 hypothetical protein EV193_10584 [Herbihabitans rhizosphaerae]